MITTTTIPLRHDKFFVCECGSEGLLVTNFTDNPEQEIYLTMFSHGTYNPKPGLLIRLKHAFRYLRTGQIHSDQLILSFTQAKELSDHLIKIRYIYGES